MDVSRSSIGIWECYSNKNFRHRITSPQEINKLLASILSRVSLTCILRTCPWSCHASVSCISGLLQSITLNTSPFSTLICRLPNTYFTCSTYKILNNQDRRKCSCTPNVRLSYYRFKPRVGGTAYRARNVGRSLAGVTLGRAMQFVVLRRYDVLAVSLQHIDRQRLLSVE